MRALCHVLLYIFLCSRLFAYVGVSEYTAMSVGKRIAIVAYSSASIGLIGYGDYLLGQLGIEEWLATQNITKSMFLTIVAGIYGSIVAHGSIILAQLYRTASGCSIDCIILPANHSQPLNV